MAHLTACAASLADMLRVLSSVLWGSAVGSRKREKMSEGRVVDGVSPEESQNFRGSPLGSMRRVSVPGWWKDFFRDGMVVIEMRLGRRVRNESCL